MNKMSKNHIQMSSEEIDVGSEQYGEAVDVVILETMIVNLARYPRMRYMLGCTWE